jgi:hypothetical protein
MSTIHLAGSCGDNCNRKLSVPSALPEAYPHEADVTMEPKDYVRVLDADVNSLYYAML